MFGGLTGGLTEQRKAPRDENYWDMWKFTFCPNFSACSFTFFLFLINTVMYIYLVVATCFLFDKGLDAKAFLGPDLALLNTYGARNPWEMRYNYQLWRLVTPMFLSTGFSQWSMNCIALMILGFMLESSKVGILRMGLFYFICVIGGEIFGAVCSSDLMVGN